MLAVMYNAIAADLQRMGAEYTPLFLEHAEPGEEIALAEHWAHGFLAGMHLRRPAWERLLQSEQGKLSLAAIVAFMTDGSGNSIMEGPIEDVARAKRDALEWIGPAVFEISEYWRATIGRSAPARAVDPFRKIGRNAPCPCGSGKKHKKCCLVPPSRESD
jgi:uncharacterized protein